MGAARRMEADLTGTATDHTHWDVRNGVAIVTASHPPVNALVQPMRQELWDAVERAEEDPSIVAILIQADGRTFPAGTDVREFDHARGAPSLAALCDRIESCAKPVIAAIHGTALGGGLELALACHYRVALEDAQFGFPEVNLGVVPAAGGSQRVTRIVGASVALDLLVRGKTIDAGRAESVRLVDQVVTKNLPKAAFAKARSLAEAGAPPVPTRSRAEGLAHPKDFLEDIAAARRTFGSDPRPAARRGLDLIEAALLLPVDAGFEMERVAYEDLVRSDEARALRHAFLAERRAGRFPALAGATARKVGRVGVIGAGPLALNTALAALGAGFSVTVALEDDSAISRLRPRLQEQLAKAVENGRLTAQARDDRLARLSTSEDFTAFGDVDVVVDALPEDTERKVAALTRVGSLARPDALVASSTAICDPARLSAACGRPENFAIFHLASAAEGARLAEIAPGPGTDPATLLTLAQFARAMGKVPLMMAARSGLVFERLRRAYYTAAALLLEGGARPADVDGALREFGMPLGPCQAQDISGIDAIWGLTLETCESAVPGAMIENAWYGRRSGVGFYSYTADDGVARTPETVLRAIAALPTARPLPPEALSVAAIQARCLYAMANEGARLVSERVVVRPSDVDVALLFGLGLPRLRGGAMFQADLAGALQVRKSLKSWAGEHAFWHPSPLWDDLVKRGLSFEDMNSAPG